MSVSRFSAALSSLSLDQRIRTAAKRERNLLVDAGTHLFESTEPLPADAQPAKDRVKTLADVMATLGSELAQSLSNDRRDYKKASQLMRWVVVGRGFLDRWILHDRLRSHRKERKIALRALGEIPFDGQHNALRDTLPATLRDDVLRIRTIIDATREERTRLLAPWNGKAFPDWLTDAVREARVLSLHVWEQVARRLFLRLPASAALIAGWWVAHHYTANALEVLGQKLGFGGRTAISYQTLQRLTFWLPILAAALCSYITNFLAKQVQKKYAPPEDQL